MSLDFWLVVEPCPHCGAKPDEPSHNITHNLAPMAKAAGIYDALWCPKTHGYRRAKEIVQVLEDGLSKLKASPLEFHQVDAPNGWGTYPDFVRFVECVLADCKKHPEAKIEVWA